MQSFLSAEDSGRVLKYNPSTKETTVLVRNLQFPNGVSLSKDGSFFVFCEVVPASPHVNVMGHADKPKTLITVALDLKFPLCHGGAGWCRLRKYWLKGEKAGGRAHAVVVKYSPEGKLLQILEDSQGKVVKAISEVEEKDGKLWIGSVFVPYVAVYQL
ncbi:hypothetical protein RHSIM_RhsimUnG0207600 [Rhododendron simsii]|uniref:Strictosidine synthase conserved region domain-containing protein n=1 Tax=Rhododendron simsii TaxID=118357 RepID=A0A834FTW8_RHOSS|nr:hypothetical protein RHSIM_RhsimUnG0207600 [Rhododendron simsii]